MAALGMNDFITPSSLGKEKIQALNLNSKKLAWPVSVRGERQYNCLPWMQKGLLYSWKSYDLKAHFQVLYRNCSWWGQTDRASKSPGDMMQLVRAFLSLLRN